MVGFEFIAYERLGRRAFLVWRSVLDGARPARMISSDSAGIIINQKYLLRIPPPPVAALIPGALLAIHSTTRRAREDT